MKKLSFTIALVSIIWLVLLTLAILCFNSCNNYIKNNDHVFHFMLYSHIQYNGVDYYQAEQQTEFPLQRKGEEEEGTVYLVDEKLNVRYKYPYKAYGYEGDDNHEYLFFDSAIYVRADMPKELRSEHNRNKE